MRAERLVMGALGGTPEHHVPTAHLMTEQLLAGYSEASVPTSDTEHLQSMRDMRDQTRSLVNGLGAESVRMATLAEQSAAELRESQERFAADLRQFQGGTRGNDAGVTQHLAFARNEESVPSRPHVVSEHEPLDVQKPLCAICGDRTNRRVRQDLDPHSPTYQECSTTCSNTCRSLEDRALQEVGWDARK